MKTKQPKINVLAEKVMSITAQQELDCSAARIWCANNNGKWMHVSIGKGRWLAFHDDGDTMITMLTNPASGFPPIDAAMLNGDMVTRDTMNKEKRNY